MAARDSGERGGYRAADDPPDGARPARDTGVPLALHTGPPFRCAVRGLFSTALDCAPVRGAGEDVFLCTECIAEAMTEYARRSGETRDD